MPTASPSFKAGLARRVITPKLPMFMAGFAGRDHPSEGVRHDLWTKALAVEDAAGNRTVFTTTDIIGLTEPVCSAAAERVKAQHGVERGNLVFNASHTHSGPILSGVLTLIANLDDEHNQRIDDYTAELVELIAASINEALDNLEPAELSFGHGFSTFAVNRREVTPNGVINRHNPEGPSDHDVPVLKVAAPDGALRAILYGYACHTTSLGDYLFNGDWAGFGQIALEEHFPGVQAMFMQLCGADQNPLPRGTVEQSETYGAQIAAAVRRTLVQPLRTLEGSLNTAYDEIELTLEPHTRDIFEKRLLEEVRPEYPWPQVHAREMLRQYDEGIEIHSIQYPVQVVAFGDQLTMIFLAAEVVIDYVLRAKRELGAEGLVVAGYTNEIMSYIPSQRVLREGGYEAGESNTYFGLPSFYTDDIEERIFTAIHRLVGQVREQ